MSLPLPPKSDPYLAGIAERRTPPLPLPPVPEFFIQVQHEGFDRIVMRLPSPTAILTRNDVFRLIGMLEREGAKA